MVLVEAPLVVVEGEKLEHDSVLVVLVGIHRRVHERRDELVQAVAVGEGGAQLLFVDGNVIPVAPVLGVVPSRNVGTRHLEHVLCIVHVGVGTNPLRHHLLHGVAVHQLVLLEHLQRVGEGLLVHVGVSDAHDERIDELVVVRLVHGIEQRVHCRVDSLLRGVWNPLLEVVGPVEPYVREDCRVFSCHICCSCS